MTLNSNHQSLDRDSPISLDTPHRSENNLKSATAGWVFLAVVAALLAVTYGAISLSGSQAEIRASLHS